MKKVYIEPVVKVTDVIIERHILNDSQKWDVDFDPVPDPNPIDGDGKDDFEGWTEWEFNWEE